MGQARLSSLEETQRSRLKTADGSACSMIYSLASVYAATRGAHLYTQGSHRKHPRLHYLLNAPTDVDITIEATIDEAFKKRI